MEKIAVFVNDAEFARHVLQPMLDGAEPTHWILVGCPPALTRHIGRWVSQAWRERWGAEVFARLEPELTARAGSQVEKLLPRRPLAEISARLQARLPGVRLLDARRPRLGHVDEPLTATQPSAGGARESGVVAAATGLAAMLALAD